MTTQVWSERNLTVSQLNNNFVDLQNSRHTNNNRTNLEKISHPLESDITWTLTLTLPNHLLFQVDMKQNWKYLSLQKCGRSPFLLVSGGETAETATAVRKVQINTFPTETHICQMISQCPKQ